MNSTEELTEEQKREIDRRIEVMEGGLFVESIVQGGQEDESAF